jgi:hypothetical protein
MGIRSYAFLFRFGNRFSRKSSKEVSFSSRECCPAELLTDSARVPQIGGPAPFPSGPMPESAILVMTNTARLRSSFSSIDKFLVPKLVKPTRVFCSGPPYQCGLGEECKTAFAHPEELGVIEADEEDFVNHAGRE